MILCYLIIRRDDWVDTANSILNCCGRVLPNTITPCHLYATFDGNRRTIGESFLDNPELRLPPIREFNLCRVGERNSEDIPAYGTVIDAINQQNIIVIAPGSFYASVISSLLSKGM